MGTDPWMYRYWYVIGPDRVQYYVNRSDTCLTKFHSSVPNRLGKRNVDYCMDSDWVPAETRTSGVLRLTDGTGSTPFGICEGYVLLLEMWCDSYE